MDLWKDQQRAVELARKQKNLAVLFKMGTGKTRTLIEILREDYNQHKRIRRTLIFAPLSVCSQWKSQFGAYMPKLEQKKIHVLTQSGASRSKAIRGLTDGVVITNYEGVQITGFYEELVKWKPEILIADEAHRLKNPSSARAKRIYPLAESCDRRFILTGTLFTNSMLDVYGPYKCLDPEIFGPSFWKFRQLYFYDKNAGMPTHRHFPDWQPQADAAKRIATTIAETSVQTEHELSLPPLIKIPVSIEITGTQKKMYQMMEKEFVAELKGKTVISEFAMSVQLRLRQILAGFLSQNAADQPQYFDDNPRIAALSDLIDGIGKEKAIVWTNFIPSYKQIQECLEKLEVPYVFLTGQQSAVQKEIALQKFSGTEAQVLVSHPGAGGVGLNLAHAKYSIYYDKSFKLEDYLQSSARNHRAGSERFERVVQYSLSAQGTIDEIIEAALDNKQELGKSILEWAARKSLAQSKSIDYVRDEKEEVHA